MYINDFTMSKLDGIMSIIVLAQGEYLKREVLYGKICILE